MCVWGGDFATLSSLCVLHQKRVRSSDRIDGRANLNLASVYFDIAAGWKVNSGKDSKCTPAQEKPETRDLRWCQASQKGISGLRSALCVTSLGLNLQANENDY